MYQETFKNFMKLIRPFLKQQGFTSRRNNFYKFHKDGNVGIINFHRSQGGFGRFTINVGVFSKKLAEFLSSKEVKPSLGYFHWETRIGSLIPEKSPYYVNIDKWWEYNDKTNVEKLFNEIRQLIIDFAIPAIEKRITDKQLIEDILSDKSKNLENWDDLDWISLRNLSALYKLSGENKKLESIIHHFEKILENDPNDNVVKRHLEKLIDTEDSMKKIIPDEQAIPMNPPKKMKR